MTLDQLSERLLEDIGNPNLRHKIKWDKNYDYLYIIFNSADGDILISYRISKQVYQKIKEIYE